MSVLGVCLLCICVHVWHVNVRVSSWCVLVYVCVYDVAWCVCASTLMTDFILGRVNPTDVGHSAWPQGRSSVTIGE